MSAKTMFINLDGPANALAMNREATLCAVAGRAVFKIFALEEDGIIERTNIRVGKNPNLNYSCSDVVWNPVDEAILATAATNGAVVLWNLNRESRSKQEFVFDEHKRTVNKVCFHHDGNILLSGSQDGNVKCFDIRRKVATTNFASSSASVRDVQFCPQAANHFVAVQEDGNVQLWDIRRNDKCERQFTAHTGPVFTCDWHPDDRSFLATAGRDKTIKVWDISEKPSLSSHIQTIASVARIKWQPQRSLFIASSALVLDFTINVWDIKRPFVPYACFREHKDVTTGFAFRNDPYIMISTSKDGTLYQHSFDDAYRPSEHANGVTHCISNNGDVIFASSHNNRWRHLESKRESNVSLTNTLMQNKASVFEAPAVFVSTSNPAPGRQRLLYSHERREKFWDDKSSVLEYRINPQYDTCGLSSDWFRVSALEYRLDSQHLDDVCEHNAKVARKLGRHQVCQTWLMLKTLYSRPNLQQLQSKNASGAADGGTLHDDEDGPSDNIPTGASRHNSGNHRHHSGHSAHSSATQAPGGGKTRNPTGNDVTGLAVESGVGDGALQQHDDADLPPHDDPFESQFCDTIVERSIQFQNEHPEYVDWSIPKEGFLERHSLNGSSASDDEDASLVEGVVTSHDASTNHEESCAAVRYNSGDTSMDGTGKSAKVLTVIKLPTADCAVTFEGELISEMLHRFVDEGDVQMSVSILIVLGVRLKNVPSLPTTTRESWISCYIDLLSRFELWNVLNRVILLCKIPAIEQLNQQSTTVHSVCGSCDRSMTVNVKPGQLRCLNCRSFPSRCVICHEVTRGLYVWCQGCCHGGHLNHLDEWFQVYKFCPTGCGHICEFA